MDPDRFLTYSLRDSRLTHILAAALEAVDPGRIVKQQLENTSLPSHDRIFLLGIGKAAESMTNSAANLLEEFDSALIITKQALGSFENIAFSKIRGQITVMEAGHPIPDERSLKAGLAVLDFVASLNEKDLLICLISGGGSALVAAPCDGLTLEDTQGLTKSLLTLGATIDELNLLRSQIDKLKGGGLAKATKAKIISLILSDVIGDHLGTIASGLTVSGSPDKESVLAVLEKYRIDDRVSRTVLTNIARERIFDPPIFDRVQNQIVANNKSAAQGALMEAVNIGFSTEIINIGLVGEARPVGENLGDILVTALHEKKHPFCLIFGGETTVAVRGTGKGGRNQELALAAVDILKDSKNGLLIALATDGNDGPTDAAGAVVNGETYWRSLELGMVPSEYLSRNDSYPFFNRLGDLLKPGYTGTNVNDLIFLFGL